MKEIINQWLEAKEAEAQAVANRRAIEDQLSEAFAVSESDEGIKTVAVDGYKVKITSRIDRKVDADKLAKLAANTSIPAPVWQGLVRWKAEVNTKSYKDLPEETKAILADAFTLKAGRPSYQITQG